MIRLICAVALLIASSPYAWAQRASEETHTVGRGDSLYGIVAIYYPDRMARWTDVAADLVALNPDTFPQGLDTVMRLGDELILVDYTPTENAVPAAEATAQRDQGLDPLASAATPDRTGNEATRQPDTMPGQADSAQASVGSGNATHAKTPGELTSPDAAQSGQPIGYVVSLDSRALATDHQNQQRSLSPNDRIYAGDAVSTVADSTVLVRMLDEAEYLIQPASRLMFEDYQYDPGTEVGSAILTLIKGGFRSTTGSLSLHQPDAVAVNTAVATVGIRGTEFALRVCARDTCRATQNAAPLEPGLYSGVLEGSLVLSNNTGDLETGRGEFFHIAAPNTVPVAAPDSASLLFNTRELAELDVVIEKEQPLSFLGWLKQQLFGD